MPTGPRKGVQGGEDGSEDEEIQRCPICLNIPRPSERAVPDSCSHLYCFSCILRWAQMVQACPVDRRPFSAIGRHDPVLGYVKIPVKTVHTDVCIRKDDETVEGPSRKGTSKIGGEEGKRANGEMKSQICDGDSSKKRKKVRTEKCHSQLLSHNIQPGLPAQQGESLSMLTQIVTETIALSEGEPADEDWRHCRRNMMEHQWMPVPVPISSAHLASRFRHCRSGHSLHQPQLILSTSPCPLRSGFPVLYGKVCAVTCPKGEGRKGTRGSGSKNSTDQEENVTSRRSSRQRKSVNEEPLSTQPQQSDSDSSSPSGSALSDTHASTSKEKQVGKQKPGIKRKGGSKKKSTRQTVVESEEEEDTEKEHEAGQGSLEKTVVDVEESEGLGTHMEATAALSPYQGDVSVNVDTGPDSVDHGDGDDGDDEEDGSKMDTEDLVSPVECDPVSPVFQQQHDEDSETENVVEPKDNQALPQENLEISSEKEAVEKETTEPEREPSVEKEQVSLLSTPCDDIKVMGSGDTLDSLTDQPQDDLTTAKLSPLDKKPESETPVESSECESVTNEVSKFPVSGSSSPQLTIENCSIKEQDTLVTPERKQEGSPDVSGHQDNTDSIPMDCDSPGSDNTSFLPEMVSESSSVVPAPPVSSIDQIPSQDREQKDQEQEPKSEPSKDQRGSDRRDGRSRKSRFHSPTTTWSPKRESREEGPQRSRSRDRDRSRNTSSPPPRSRGRDHEEDRGSSRRNRSRDRRSRRRSRSRSKSRSRSRSRSRNRPNRRSLSPDRSDQGAQSPRKRDSWGGDGWRGARNFRNSNWRNNSDRQNQFSARESNSSGNGNLHETSPDRGQSENPPWVKERSWVNADSRERDQRFDENSGDAPADSWSRGGWASERGRGRAGQRSSGFQGDSADHWRQQRNSFSGTANNAGNDSYSRFNENRPGGKRKEPETSDTPLDRSGWSSASSWAVRRTLPADVQNYYSRRERGPGPGGSIWNRQEEDQPAAGFTKQTDLPQSEPSTHLPNEAVPAPPAVIPHQLNVLGVLRYPMGPMGPRAPSVSLQPAPFTIPPQIPVHLHPTGPPLSIASMAVQSLPPPPPPPPPVQQGSLTVLPTDSLPQVITSFPVPAKAPLKVTPNKVTPSQAHPTSTLSVAQPSSTTQPPSHSKAHADSSKKEKKLQIQERAISEVKAAIKPYYQKKDITKEEYKEIVRKAVEKVCHSKSGEVNADKVANLVKAYVDKYKHVRKNKADKN